MLVLQVRYGQEIYIGDDIVISTAKGRGRKHLVKIVAPDDIKVKRQGAKIDRAGDNHGQEERDDSFGNR